MPDQDGYSLISHIREQGIQIPAIALTAYARVEDRIRALSAAFKCTSPNLLNQQN